MIRHLAFRWRADDGPLIVLFGPTHSSSTKKRKKNVIKVGPPLTKFSGTAHEVSNAFPFAHLLQKKNLTVIRLNFIMSA